MIAPSSSSRDCFSVMFAVRVSQRPWHHCDWRYGSALHADATRDTTMRPLAAPSTHVSRTSRYGIDTQGQHKQMPMQTNTNADTNTHDRMLSRIANDERRTANGQSEWRMANDEWRTTNDERRKANGQSEWRPTNDDRRTTNGEWRTTNDERTNDERRTTNATSTAPEHCQMLRSSSIHSFCVLYISFISFLTTSQLCASTEKPRCMSFSSNWSFK